jgi:hypothetical protein
MECRLPQTYAPARKGLSRTFRNGNLSVICPIPAVCPCVLGRFNTAGQTSRFGHGTQSCDTALQKVEGAVLEPRHTLVRPQGFQSLAPLQVGSFATCRLPKIKVKGVWTKERGFPRPPSCPSCLGYPTYTPLQSFSGSGLRGLVPTPAPRPSCLGNTPLNPLHTQKFF